MKTILLRVGCVGVLTLGCSAGDPSVGAGTEPVLSVESRLDSIGNALGPVAAKVVAANKNGPAPLARLAIPDDALLEFYEFTPGQIAVSGAGGAARLINNVSFDDVAQAWTLYSGGAPVPASLAAALARQAALRSNQSAKGGTEPRQGKTIASNGAAGSSASGGAQPNFAGGYCDTTYFTRNESPLNEPMGDCPSNFDGRDCVSNWFGGRTSHSTNVIYYYANSCAKINSHQLNVNYGPNSNNWLVPEESGRWSLMYTIGDCGHEIFEPDCYDATTTVTNAASSEFNERHLVYYGD